MRNQYFLTLLLSSVSLFLFSQKDSVVYSDNNVNVGVTVPYVIVAQFDSTKVVFEITATNSDPDPEIFVNNLFIMKLSNVIVTYTDSFYVNKNDEIKFTVPDDNPTFDGRFGMTIRLSIKVDTTNQNPSGLALNEFKADLEIYPNPATSFIQVSSLYTNKKLHFNIVNSFGQIIKYGILEDRISVDDLPKGIYTLQLSGVYEHTRTKFMKK